MPENIFKVYRPDTKSSEQDKKGRGLWYDDNEYERYKHVLTALSRYCDNDKDYDYLDLVWHIKNAVIGGVYVSQDVFDGIKDPNQRIWGKYVWIDADGKVQPIKKGEVTDQFLIIRDIIEGRAKLGEDGVFDDMYLEIRKWTGKKEAGTKESLIFEHVIPAKVYIKELIRAYEAHEFNEKYFREFRRNILVCIVTSEQNGRLNKWKNSMPPLPGDDWTTVTQNRLARYKNVKPPVLIHGLQK